MNDHLPVKLDEVREIPAFRDLPLEQVRSVSALMVRSHYAPGQIIFLEGEKACSLWFVFEGRVKIIKQSLNGRVQGLCLMNQGKCFGGCSLFDMKDNPATAQALDHVTLFVLPETGVEKLGASDPNLVKALLHVYSQRLEHLARVSETLGAWTAADRINDCLLTYANRATQEVVVELTHERLAALSGTVREVVTRHLNLLEKEGIVHNESRRIILLNPDALLPPCACDEQRPNVI
ncbi:MAG: Crp/Fnr family transcriptional regulator [Anaerolineae bacterium]|jgi:CRP/FNR family transcriptional regulator|nr:Crp/Fnr family transcriptional regulator [Chloroflexota bacterium]MBN8617473.1 Crp/Fnr family transcriptional regulator [Anaerolineae bacterium]MBN8637389.1 Crp/Fnr family transcriptional regulator [Anaerolineae bacterium]